MKICNPKSRRNLAIKSSDYVLEVGGGHNPHPRANVVVDKFVDTNYHRSGDIKVYKNQQFIQADGENLPFKDKEFDYVICNQVLEHVESPERFIAEQVRVAKRGYIEVPSLIGEHLFPKASHRWLILEIDNHLVLVEKEKVGFHTSCDFGSLFLDYLPRNSIGYKILQRTHANLQTVRYEWADGIDFIINPPKPEILKYFKDPWNYDMVKEFFPKKTLPSEFLSTMGALMDITKNIIKSKVISKVAKKDNSFTISHAEEEKEPIEAEARVPLLK